MNKILSLREKVLDRKPPGDRWESADGVVHDSLTEGLEHVFELTATTNFVIMARDGIVYTFSDDGVVEEITEKIEQDITTKRVEKKWNIYDDTL